MVEAIGQVFPQAKYQRCIVHFYRNVFSVVPKHKVNETAKMLKAIHAQEDKTAAREKAKQVAEKLRGMKLSKAASKVEEFIEETLTYMNFPEQHWTRIRTNNTLERLNREIKRRTKVVGHSCCVAFLYRHNNFFQTFRIIFLFQHKITSSKSLP